MVVEIYFATQNLGETLPTKVLASLLQDQVQGREEGRKEVAHHQDEMQYGKKGRW